MTPPWLVPAALSALALRLARDAHRAHVDAEHLLRRSLAHSACRGDASVVTVLRSDAAALGGWATRVAGAGAGVDLAAEAARRRLVHLATLEAAVRAALARRWCDLGPLPWAWGPGPWVATPGGPVCVPVVGDPAWEVAAGRVLA